VAKFNPDTSIDSGREYDFRGAQPNRAGEVLLEGLSSAAGNFIEAQYKAVNEDIRKRARAGEEGIQDNLFNTPDLSAAQSSTTEAGAAKPEDLVRGIGKMERLKNAWTKGAITESDYLSSIDVLTKSLRSRYGDKWADEIDAAVAGAVSNSANAYRRQLFQEWDAGKSASQKQLDKESDWKWQFVKENKDDLYNNPDMIENPDQYSRSQLLSESMKQSVPRKQTEQTLTDYRLRKEQGEVTDEDTAQTGRVIVSKFVEGVVDRAGANIGSKFTEMVRIAKSDGTVDKKEKDQLLAYITEAEPYILQGINGLLLGEDFSGMKESDKLEMMAIGKRTVEMFRSQLYDEQIGLFNLGVQSRKFAAEDNFLKIMKINPDIANLTAFNDALKAGGMDGFLNTQLTEQMGEAVPDPKKVAESIIAGSVLVGDKSLNEFVQSVWDAREDPKRVIEVFKTLRDAVTSEETATKAKAQAASVLFAPENSEYLSQGMVDGVMATKIYNELTTGDMIKTMNAMKGTDMVTWDNYYNWVFDPGFKAVFQYEMNSVVPYADQVNLKFDFDTMSFSSKVLSKETGAGRGPSRNTEAAIYTENFTKRLNVWIKKVTPILESNGDDIRYELNRVFEANGLGETKEGSDTGKVSFMEKAYSAMKKEREKKEAEEKSTEIPQ
jgi:hypothetical protein